MNGMIIAAGVAMLAAAIGGKKGDKPAKVPPVKVPPLNPANPGGTSPAPAPKPPVEEKAPPRVFKCEFNDVDNNPLRYGSCGNNVKILQKWINNYSGYGVKVAEDGAFGQEVEAVIMRFTGLNHVPKHVFNQWKTSVR